MIDHPVCVILKVCMSCCNSRTGHGGGEAGAAVPVLQVGVMETETSDSPRVMLHESQQVGVLGMNQSRCGRSSAGDRPDVRTWCLTVDHT